VNRTVLSAHRTRHDPRRHALLGCLLTTLGFRAQEVAGQWRGRPELGWEVTDLPSPLALFLARLFDQQAVLANDYLYLLDTPASGGIWARPVLHVDDGPTRGHADATQRPDGSTWRAVLGPPEVLRVRSAGPLTTTRWPVPVPEVPRRRGLAAVPG
jgi:hypothetical protein